MEAPPAAEPSAEAPPAAEPSMEAAPAAQPAHDWEFALAATDKAPGASATVMVDEAEDERFRPGRERSSARRFLRRGESRRQRVHRLDRPQQGQGRGVQAGRRADGLAGRQGRLEAETDLETFGIVVTATPDGAPEQIGGVPVLTGIPVQAGAAAEESAEEAAEEAGEAAVDAAEAAGEPAVEAAEEAAEEPKKSPKTSMRRPREAAENPRRPLPTRTRRPDEARTATETRPLPGGGFFLPRLDTIARQSIQWGSRWVEWDKMGKQGTRMIARGRYVLSGSVHALDR